MKSFKEFYESVDKNKSYDTYRGRNKEKIYDGDEETHGSAGAGKFGTKKATDKFKSVTPGQNNE